MARTKISEFSATPGNNTDIDGINIAEGCAPSGINDAIRELMSQLKDFQAGTAGDSFNGPVGTTTAAAGAFTTLSASSTVSGTGFSNYLASPPAIGGTAAAAGSFTTLSASSTVTLSGGTANGVLYLNGSKVATSGSALTFDGTKLAVAGSSNSSASLVVAGANSNNGILQLASTGTAYTMSGGDYQGNWLFTIGGNYPYIWNINGSEQMRLTSTGLGVGTSSPAYKLDVYASGGTSIAVGATTGKAFVYGDNTGATLGTISSIPLRFSINSVEQMRLDSSGNLGIGVTPSAWNNTYKVQQIGDASFLYGRNNGSTFETGLGSNWYRNSGGSFLYLNNGYATLFGQVSGGFQWYTAASGTAGNAISFTQAMTLDASGNLGVGTTSPTYKVDLGWTDTSIGWYLSSSYSASISLGSGARSLTIATKSGDGADFIAFKTGTSSTERARITSTGDVVIGGVSANGKFMVYDANASIRATAPSGPSIRMYAGTIALLETSTNDDLIIRTNSTERARFDTSGNLLVGTTSQVSGGTSRSTFVYDQSDYSITAANSHATVPYGQRIIYTVATPNNTSSAFIYCADATAQRATVRSNGGFANYQANDVNLSDRREKTDFAPAKSYLETICAIPVQTFKYIDQTDDEKTLGVVAQDVQAVAPELVHESNWAKDGNDPKMRLSIYQTDLQYALMKCIQELKAEVDSLKSQLKGA